MDIGRALHRHLPVPSSTVSTLTPLHEAQSLVVGSVTVNEPCTMRSVDADGCVLAEDVVAGEDVPPFDNSAVDGYALRAACVATVPAELRVIGEIAAGVGATKEVTEGTAVRIMTGAPVPAGCDAVVMVEDTTFSGTGDTEIVLVRRTVEPGAGIRRAGSDVVAGETVFSTGLVVGPAVIGVLASINANTIRVHRRPRVAVLSTGDELVDDGGPLGPGQIRESNRSMLLRLVSNCGCDAVDMGIVRDDETTLETVLREAAATCDAVVTSGGVSMGDYDVVKAVLARIAQMRWMQLAIKPAKPFAFGLLTSGERSVPVFGLPGNPVSSLVSFELLARPALRTIAGHRPESAWRPRVSVVVDDDVRRKRDGKTHYDRVRARWGDDGRLHVTRQDAQGSHQLAASASSNALLEVPDGDGLKAGDSAIAVLIGPA